MYLCYVDESGCTGSLPSPDSPIQPAFVIAGVSFRHERLKDLTLGFLALKRRFFPGTLCALHHLDDIHTEIKGSEVRKSAAIGTSKQRRHAIGFLDGAVRLLQDNDARVFGRVWIKGIGQPMDGTSVYTSSIQYICSVFHEMLAQSGNEGFVIADGRNKPKNVCVSHSVFTQKFQRGGDPLGRLIEMPTFGHSDNHAGLQIADLLCSALLFPIAVEVFCSGYVTNLHVRPEYKVLRERYGEALKELQFRFVESASGRWRGGITVDDRHGMRPGGLLFKKDPPSVAP